MQNSLCIFIINVLKGTNMNRGCQPLDYSVTIGDEVCVIETLTDNEMTCLPPSQASTQNKSDAQCCFCSIEGTLDCGN